MRTNQRVKKLSRQELDSKLEKAQHVIQKIIYRNSHDLRGPVSTLMSIVYILNKSEIGQKEKQLVKYLNVTIRRLDKIIRDINSELTEEH